MSQSAKPRTWSWVLLFTTSTTLICCAIPITLVSLGLGAAVASMASAAPWIVTLSLYKGWVFFTSGALISLAAWAVYRPGRACPTDPELAAACERADVWNRRFVGFSGLMWSVGFFAAIVLPVLSR
jgi:mercuric ion transport protein